jgi:hypothetical protein
MAMIGVGLIGPETPPGFTAQPFNCPAGSDYTKSQEVGMCVGPAYDPIYSQITTGGVRTYYDLTGAAVGQDKPAAPAESLIPGIADAYLYAAGAALALVLLLKVRK